MSCRHCGSDCTTQETKDPLSIDEWQKLIDHVCANFSSELAFVFTGGEPLLYPGLCDLGRRISTRGRRWGLVTNGYALDEDTLAKLIAAGVGSITISLDGDRDQHTWLRRNPESFDRALRALKLVGKTDIENKDAVTCVHPGNLNNLDRIGALLHEAGIRQWRLFRIFPLGRAAQNSELMLGNEGEAALVRWIADNRRRYRSLGVRIELSCEGWLPYGLDRRVRNEPFFCRSGINIASVLADGCITGCSNNASHLYQGNIRTTSLAQAWEHGFSVYRNRRQPVKGPCASCREFSNCLGGSAHLWKEAGSYTESCPISSYFER